MLRQRTGNNFSWTIIFLVILFSQPSAVLADELRFGMSAALSGPLKDVGNNMRLGIEAYFAKVNRQGGIRGDKLTLLVRDDQYEPRLTAPNTRDLIETDQVLAMIGNVGTPTAVVTVPIITELKTTLFAPLSGASFLREMPPNPYIYNYRASYQDEAAAMINWVLDMGIRPEEIAFFSQRDSYGDAGYRGAINTLEQHGFMQAEKLPHVRYTRNTLNVEDALANYWMPKQRRG